MASDSDGISEVAVVGAGAWGTAIANLLAIKGHLVRLWAREPHVMESIAATHFNDTYLPGFRLSENVHPMPELEACLHGMRLIVLAIPVQYLRARLTIARQFIQPNAVLINLGKGLEKGTLYRPSEIILSEIDGTPLVGTLSGPTIASEVARHEPSKAVISLMNHRRFPGIERVFSNESFSVEPHADLVGVELGGALKNTVALAAGISDGLEYGTNFKSCVLTQGLAEIRSIGNRLGANPETFFGLSGLGDTMTTCFSPESRNRRFGEALGRGAIVQEASHSLGSRVAEGVDTTAAAYQLAEELQLDCPLISTLYRILFESSPSESLVDSMSGRN